MAAIAKQTAFVCKLVECLNKEDLELQNKYGQTAFYYAAMSGVVEIAKVMYEKNNALPTIRDENKVSPIRTAVLMGNKKMVEYLYKITPLQNFKDDERMDILVATIDIGMYGMESLLTTLGKITMRIMLRIVVNLLFLCADIVLNILKADRSIITSPDVDKGSALHALARKPFSYYGTSQEWIFESLARIVPYIPCFKRIYCSIEKRRQASQLVEKLCEQIVTLEESAILNIFCKTSILEDAAKIGNVEFLTLLANSYPDFIRRLDKNNYSIFHVAVIYRQEKVFSLIYRTGAIGDILMLFKDESENNILHLAAKLAPSSRLNSVSGAALQMQRELLWFKEVEKNLRPSYLQEKNKKGETPRELFTEEHEKLREAGEKWMKDTAASCMVVAALIATVAFAAAFTVPGGNKEETGAPIFLNNRWFTVFVISDAVALFSSTDSIMIFLSILTSRYGEEDFLYTLPAKLMVGLITLFASIVCMDLTFSATFFLVYKEEKQGILPKIIAGLALLPISLYAMLNFKLWISLIHSTIWASRFMFRPVKHRLF
ncbi:ankyrin repeat-containing At5g02620-like [Olea europaea subsp. europaea]|uniref:Ankyrin repeat-containing At5g02620-like n=1 Tax=Olea europaea subsp. europaea TaxID=158383 RepID=A0A8S0UNS6_OLEEU|nr:ankyrin repeat-containing At5g02620-like [Olea europaea subsp. europaea]